MKAAVLHHYDEKLTAEEFVTYEDVTDPKIEQPNHVIVRIGGAGVCRTDLHVVEGIWREKTGMELPYIMGHENAGWIEEVGPGVTDFKKGDPVICHPLVTSGHCLACRRGDDMHADGSSFPGINANGWLRRVSADGCAVADQAAAVARPEGRRALHGCRPPPHIAPPRRPRAISCRANLRYASGLAVSDISAFRF